MEPSLSFNKLNNLYLIDKEENILKRGSKRTTQGIQDLYTHRQNGFNRRRSTKTERAKTTSTRVQPIKETN